MAEENKYMEQSENLQVWKVIGVFALLFLALQLAVVVLGVGINLLMNTLDARENTRIFIGSTISRGGMIAAALSLTIPVMNKVLKKNSRDCLFPLQRKWAKDLLTGLGISFVVMGVIFLIELALGWLRFTGWSLANQGWAEILRTFWLAVLVNATAAVAEETLFRGFLMSGLKQAWDNQGALLISSVIFGGAHILVAGAQESNWLEFILLLALPGWMLGWAYLRSGNLWLSTGLHFAWNFFQDDIFNLGGGLESETLLGWQTIQSGPAVFVGSSFGIEVGLAGILAVMLAGVGIAVYTHHRRLPE